jgi:hypothetical protein
MGQAVQQPVSRIGRGEVRHGVVGHDQEPIAPTGLLRGDGERRLVIAPTAREGDTASCTASFCSVIPLQARRHEDGTLTGHGVFRWGQSHAAMLVVADKSTNLTGGIIDRLGPMLALQPPKRFTRDNCAHRGQQLTEPRTGAGPPRSAAARTSPCGWTSSPCWRPPALRDVSRGSDRCPSVPRRPAPGTGSPPEGDIRVRNPAATKPLRRPSRCRTKRGGDPPASKIPCGSESRSLYPSTWAASVSDGAVYRC